MKATAILTTMVLFVAAAGTVNALSVDVDRLDLLGATPAAAEGTSYDCLDYNVLYEVAGVESPLAEPFDVSAGASWSASSPDADTVYVDFFDADGNSVSYGENGGSVPSGASYGIACVALVAGYPAVPAPAAAFTYSE